MELVPDTRTLLPKLPYWLTYLFGGSIAVERSPDYDKDGKIQSWDTRILQVINNQQLNKLVKKSRLTKWGASSTTRFYIEDEHTTTTTKK